MHQELNVERERRRYWAADDVRPKGKQIAYLSITGALANVTPQVCQNSGAASFEVRIRRRLHHGEATKAAQLYPRFLGF